MKLVLGYKNFGARAGVSHIGLGVSAINTMKVLRAAGHSVEILPLKAEGDLKAALLDRYGSATHVVVSAPWISTAAYAELCALFPDTTFAMNCHSNVGFLQADSRGIELMREQLGLEAGVSNFHVSANSERLRKFIEQAYRDPCLFLPNLYWLDGLGRHARPSWHHNGGTLRIGIFGATRPLKNFLSAIGAAIVIGQNLKAETEIWISTGRVDSHEVGRILAAAKNLTANLPGITLKEAPWAPWPSFRKIVGSMHLLLQPSYTESFNMVTADGVAEGVPSVVSDAIHWAPAEWRADVDDVENIARVGMQLLHDPRSGWNGLDALQRYNEHGVRIWERFMT